MSHTPGPWEIYEGEIRAGGPMGTIICESIQHKADAALICAAPEMLEALKSVLWIDLVYAHADLSLVYAAIAKAEAHSMKNESRAGCSR